MYPKGNLLIPAPHGQLEAIYRPEHEQAERVALVLHPHPQHGGTMHNKVVFRAARANAERGHGAPPLSRPRGRSTWIALGVDERQALSPHIAARVCADVPSHF